MNSLRNSVRLTGNVGAEPEIIVLDSGKKLAKFSIATNEEYKNAKGDKVTSTQWHSCVAWGNIINVVEGFIKKGSEISIEGSLKYNSYETKEGEKRQSTEINVNEILLLGSKKA